MSIFNSLKNVFGKQKESGDENQQEQPEKKDYRPLTSTEKAKGLAGAASVYAENLNKSPEEQREALRQFLRSQKAKHVTSETEYQNFNSYCAEFIVLRETIRNPANGTEESRLGFELDSDSEEKWEEILERYGRNSWEMVGNLQISFRQSPEGFPWAIIAFPQEFRLAGHLLSLRAGGKDFSFSGYSVRSKHSLQDSAPPVSMIFVYGKKSLEKLAKESPLLHPAWKALKEMPEDENWFCISDLPSSSWLANAEGNDDDLFTQYTKDLQ